MKKLLAATVAGLALTAVSGTANATDSHVSIREFHHAHQYQTRIHVEANFGTPGRLVSTECPAGTSVLVSCMTRRYPTLYGRDYVKVHYQGVGTDSELFFLVKKRWVHV